MMVFTLQILLRRVRSILSSARISVLSYPDRGKACWWREDPSAKLQRIAALGCSSVGLKEISWSSLYWQRRKLERSWKQKDFEGVFHSTTFEIAMNAFRKHCSDWRIFQMEEEPFRWSADTTLNESNWFSVCVCRCWRKRNTWENAAFLNLLPLFLNSK